MTRHNTTSNIRSALSYLNSRTAIAESARKTAEAYANTQREDSLKYAATIRDREIASADQRRAFAMNENNAERTANRGVADFHYREASRAARQALYGALVRAATSAIESECSAMVQEALSCYERAVSEARSQREDAIAATDRQYYSAMQQIEESYAVEVQRARCKYIETEGPALERYNELMEIALDASAFAVEAAHVQFITSTQQAVGSSNVMQ